MENHIVGAPCGVMDQMASACGEANKLLAMVCQVTHCQCGRKQTAAFYNLRNMSILLVSVFRYQQIMSTLLLLVQPAEVLGLVEIPAHVRFWGIDSGIRHR